MKFIVYQTINKENGKLYIGVHKTENPETFDNYIGNGIYVGQSLENPKTTYQHALKKYGYKSFIRTTLKVFDTESEAYEMEANLVTLEFIRQDNNYNIKTGGLHGSWCWKKINQFDYSGKLIKTWNSITDAIEHFSCNANRFNMAATNKYSAFESYWAYVDTIDISEYRKSKLSEVYQFNKNGEIINVFKGWADVENKLGYNKKSLEEANRNKKLYKDYYWVKDPDEIFNVIKLNKLFNLRNKSLIQFDANKNIISEFTTITEASKQLNIKYDTIKSAARLGNIVNNLFYFSYTCEIKQTSTKIEQYDYNTGEYIKTWDNITSCAKIHPKCREVLKGVRSQTHGYTFKYIKD